MKVLFAIKALDDISGGAERVLADITAGLCEKGHEISVLTFDVQGGAPFYPLHKNIKRICLGIGNVRNRSTVIESIKRIMAMRRSIKHESPDIVVGFMHSMFIPLSFALIGTNIPIIASEHIVPTHYKTRRFEFILLLLSTFFVKKITVPSDVVKKSYPKFLHDKMVSIANPVHQPNTLCNTKGFTNNRKIILSVGRLDPQKDHKTLIKAFATIATDYPEWDVRIMGDGTLRGCLEELIKKLDLENRVFLPGTTTDISSEYQKAHIFALPSLYESFGLATAEAMAHGLPVIGFADCPGTNELITNGENGLLLEGDDRSTALSDALESLIKDAGLRVSYGLQARKYKKKFSYKKKIDDWEQLLRE